MLVGLQTENRSSYDVEESLQELAHLARTANVVVSALETQIRPKPHPAYFIGSGKAKEIAKLAQREDANIIIFDDNLTPSQDRNLSKITKKRIIDRSQLILDIFAQHAQTRQSKLQVELAQLQYNLSRLKGQWTHLSRIEGGIGFRGPGEKQLEIDRRRINDRITHLKSKLVGIEQINETKRKGRKELFSASLVGYTNAGKSTVLNRLTSSHLYTADQLFATLETTTRAKTLETKERIVISDTIGFIRKIPPYLIASFHATLQEVVYSDLLLHVVDISHPKLYEYMDTVIQTLKGIHANHKDMILIFNKIDLLSRNQYLFMKKKLRIDYPDSLFVSARTGEYFDEIEQAISKVLANSKKCITLKVPNNEQKFISYLFDNAEILEKRYNNDSVRLCVKIPLEKYTKNFSLFRRFEIRTKRMAKRKFELQ
ncbi:MAG TPA: GTPase HflX [Candidatus Cloacimonetes bacterium]|nr:GTPase HflX [Candidatus Cloacimonadota bacterium]